MVAPPPVSNDREAIGPLKAGETGGGVDVAYLFPGQGSQFTGMGKDLYERYSAAKKIYDRAAELLDFDIRGVCFEGPAEKLMQTRYSQPAIFVTSLAAFEVYKTCPKAGEHRPRFLAGLSLGEATALVAAGAVSFDEGVKFVRHRGQYMDEAARETPGMMAAVMGAELAVVEAVCRETGAEVGNLNAPGQIVISGRKAFVENAVEKLREHGAKKVIPLDVSGGFHSSCMESACRKITHSLDHVMIQKPTVPVVSNLTAGIEADPARIKQNLIWQMNHRTLWEDSMRFMIGKGVKTFIEFSPGKVLKGLLRKIDPEVLTISLSTLEDFHAVE